MDNNTIYLIVSCLLLVISEILPFMPTRSKGLLQALTTVAEEVVEVYKRKEENPLPPLSK